MGFMVICNNSEKERGYLKEITKEKIAYVSEEMWDIKDYSQVEELKKYLESHPVINLAYIDVTMKSSIAIAERIRKENKQAVMLLIADTTISPMCYIKPSIMASSLLLRPLRKEQVNEVVKELVALVTDEKEENMEEIFVIENREERIKIPYERICYFEARAKKIFLCLENKEYGFYETMASLEEKLPEYFVRSHRSFIINSKKVEKIQLTQNEIVLKEGIYIPISRSYRPAIKELKKCLK